MMPTMGWNVRGLKLLLLPQCPEKGDRTASEYVPFTVWERPVLNSFSLKDVLDPETWWDLFSMPILL